MAYTSCFVFACSDLGLSGDVTANATGMSKAAVDALFEFSDSLGTQYSGAWVRADRYVVTIINAVGSTIDVGSTTVTVVTGDIRNAADLREKR